MTDGTERPVPAAAFELPILVQPQDIDELGHVNNVVYLAWVQQVARDHWFAVTGPRDRRDLAWVAARHELDYRKPAFAGEELVGRTWIGEAAGVTCERFVEIRRRSTMELLAQCRSVWVAVHPETGRPRRFEPALMEPFRRQLGSP